MSNTLYWDSDSVTWQPKSGAPSRYRTSGSWFAKSFFNHTAAGVTYARNPNMSGWKSKKEEVEPYDAAKAARGEYTQKELEAHADQMLRDAAASIDPATGKQRGIGGDNPILFPEHEYARKRREIYTNDGTPDPSLVSGIYNRSHPQGRKVNSPEQRKRNGASYYR